MSETTIGLDDLVMEIGEHLAETDERFRGYVADRIGANYTDDEDVMAGISEILGSPETEGATIVDLANELLSPTYTYEGDSIVSVTYPENRPTPAP
jgi:hypothetical protein